MTRGAVAAEPPQLSERRAAALLAAGRVEEASLVFDSIVLRYPLYRLDPAQSSPAALAAFQQSKRSLLPGLARAHVDNAEAAIAAGEFAAAIAETDRAARMVEDADIAPAPLDLSMAIHSARTRAVAGKTTLEQRVYTADDRDVIPPAPVGRQLPQAAPVGGGPIGRLEILVDRAGRVEAVKLHTPSNAYHDRMIVSAAKAWHFKPATRAGKPVRFTLIMSINLPGSD